MLSRATAPALSRIDRKTLLYRSGLGFWCINHVQGCSHACRYPCHAFMLAKRYGRTESLADWSEPKLVGNALPLLAHELRSKRRPVSEVHLCLTTDPFMYGQPEVRELSLEIIALLNRYRITCSVLTKGILPLELGDRDRFPCHNTLGISLVSLDEGFRRRWEPGAAPYAARIAALRDLHEGGRRTLVHMEPYPTPNIHAQDLSGILAKVSFVDQVFLSGWNYSPLVRQYPDPDAFYRREAQTLQRFCQEHRIAREV
jgi:DNA repair photolyase